MKKRDIDHTDDWATPQSFYEKLNKVFNFNFDPCPLNHDLALWDGLYTDWKLRNFINPPYSRKLKEAFILKAYNESLKGKICVMLLPVSTSTKIFHSIIYPYAARIIFVKGRISYQGINTKGEYTTTAKGMHDSMVVIFDKFKTKDYSKLEFDNT